MAAVTPLAINIFVPSMPSIATDLEAPYATVQLGLSSFLFLVAIMSLIGGPISDKIGRRPVLIGGLSLFLLGSIICIFASNVEMFLFGRIVQTFSAVGMVLSRAIVRDVYPREKSASMIGYVVMAMAIAPMVGPAIGGWIDGWIGWRGSFVLLAIFGATALASCIFALPETNQNRGQSMASQFKTYAQLLTMPAYWLYAITSGVASAVFFGFLGGGPAVSDLHFQQTPFEYGIYFSLCALGYSTGNFLSGRFSERVGLSRMMMVGSLVTLCGPAISCILFYMGVDQPWALFVPLALVGLGNGMILPNVTAAAISIKPEAAGAASGLLGALQIGIGALASIAGAAVVSAAGSPINLTNMLVVFAAVGLALGWAAAKQAKQTA